MRTGSKIIIVLFLIVAAAALYFYFRITPSESVLVKIPAGARAKDVAELLKEHNVITNKRIFLMALRLSGRSRKIKPGVYEFRTNISVLSVIDKLTKGLTHRIKVTIPEGLTAAQIARLLSSKGLVDEKRFLAIVDKDKLEGYLFPETYFIEADMNEKSIVAMLKKEFDRRISPEIVARAKELKLTIQQIITLASIIEKEATHNDRRLISAVFHNRLKKGMYLESCATVLYALGKHKEKLNYKDLRVKSPYNTYVHYGLPPGPICNPGMDSINAALWPEESDALFFVVDKTSGTHIFSRYYKQHIEVQGKKKQK